MKILTASPEHLPEIMRIYSAAKEYMRKNGNPTQWGGNYPQEDLVSSDIENGNLHIIIADDGHLCACFGLFYGSDPTYAKIDGAWADVSPYVAIHRVASDGSECGIFRRIFEYVSQKYTHIRIDTHENNLTMQSALKSCGFEYRGIIYVDDGTPRLAYEWSAVRA